MHINKDSFGRIEKGMTSQEVESILGGPPGNYRSCFSTRRRHTLVAGVTAQEWESDQGAIRVGFDEEGKVVQVAFDPVYAFWR